VSTNEEAVQKARQQAHRRFTIAMENVVRDSNERLEREKAQMAARGVILSGAMWKITADIFRERIEALLQARLKALLDAYELYQIPLDDEAEQSILKDVTELRQSQIDGAMKFVSTQPWLIQGATDYVSGELSRIGSPLLFGKAEIEERRHRPKILSGLPSPKRQEEALVFVSCGQSTYAERELGKSIAKLVEMETGCTAYFAENQTTLEGVTENILKRLNEAVAFIAIMHPRGDVSNPHNPSARSWVRGSVWVEQEVAIAAFISQALQRPMKVRCYVHKDIFREGLRDKLHLNPVLFERDEDIIADLTAFLPAWRTLTQSRRGLSLKPIISHRRVGIPGGSNDKDDERHMLLASVENDGEEQAREFRLDVEFPSVFIDEGGHALQRQSSKPGYTLYRVPNTHRRIEHFYPGEKAPEDLIAFHYAVRGSTKRDHPTELQKQVIATVYSGDMKPRTTTKTIAELLG
jgi:hypothetical protein